MSAHAARDEDPVTRPVTLVRAGHRDAAPRVVVAAIAALTVICLALIVVGRPQDAGGLACLALIAGTVLAIVFRKKITR